LVTIRHEDVASEWRHLCGLAFTPSTVSREPCIHSSVGRRERAIAAATEQRTSRNNPQPNPTQQPTMPNPYATQQPPLQQQQQQTPSNGTTKQQPPTDEATDGKHGDAACYGFWARQRDCIFDVRITDTDARSYRNKDYEKVIAAQEKEKKDKYLRP